MAYAPSIEIPRADLDYNQLGASVHGVVERIIGHGYADRVESSFRVDGIMPGTLDTIREILRGAEGNHLPRFTYDEAGRYKPVSRTPVVEGRITQFTVLEDRSDIDGTAWLRVPRSAEAPESVTHRGNFSKKELLMLGAVGVLGDGLVVTAVATGKAGFVAAGAVVAGAASVAAGRRAVA